ncbi:carbohydrate sulfotransferase 12-like [Diretmus argenteus]
MERRQQQQQQQQQEQRKRLLRETCGEAFPGETRTLENMTKNELKHLIVDDKHGIIYCYIPKVACTNWKRVMFVLQQGEPYQDPVSVDPDMVHLPLKFPLLNSFPWPEMKVRLKHYTKFLFVRDPFVRLISAYRNKFLQNNEYFYKRFARDMLRLYGDCPNPPESGDEAFAKGLRPSFSSFIRYLLDPQTERKAPFEPHWRQMYRLCYPCLIKYDFVGHLETLQQDTDHLLRILRLEDDIKFPPSYENVTSSGWMWDWFGTVPLEARRRLYKLYEMDFKLFGYEKPDSVKKGFVWPGG